MAPEQAKGKAVDKRADIWAFGVVLYEMLAARRLFEGETVPETLAAVMMKDPALDALPAATPAGVRKLLRRCLERDVRRRLRDIGEARIVLEEMLAGVPEEVTAPVASRRRFIFLWAILATFALMALAAVHLREKASELPVLRFTIFPPDRTVFDFTNAVQGPPAISPDGRHLVFRASGEGHSQLWLRSLDQVSAQPLAGTEEATFPFWSPDSRFIGFFAGGKLKRIDVSGGPPLTLADALNGRGGSWSKEGVIVFAPTNRGALQSVPVPGGATKSVTLLEGPADSTSHRFPWFLPDGRHFLYVSGTSQAKGILHLASLDSKQDKVLGSSGSYVVYSQGHLLFLREDTLMAQAFNAGRLATLGEAVPVAQHVAGADAVLHGAFSVAENGTLVYQQTAPASRTLVWFDRNGKRLSTVGQPARMSDLQLSPDGQSATVTVFDPLTGQGDVWIYDLTQGTSFRFTFNGANSAVWSPDGRTLAYSAVVDLYQKPLSGLSDALPLYHVDGLISSVSTWSSNGFLVYAPASFNNLWLLPMVPERPGGERKPPLRFLPTPAVVSHGQFSPDGRWMAYASNETQRFEIYASPFPGPGSKRQISIAGGIQPRWRRDGKEIFFRAPDDKLMAAQVTLTGNTLEVGSVYSLFGLAHDTTFGASHYTYDVSADGQRVLAVVPPEQTTTTPQPLSVVLNWTAALKK
jgi:Tol biopolymer transport system component